MINIAEDNRSETLSLFRNSIPTIKISPLYIIPNYTCDTIINNLNLLFINYDLCSKSKYKSNEYDSDIDNYWKYTNYGYFLKDANFFLQDEYQIYNDSPNRN